MHKLPVVAPLILITAACSMRATHSDATATSIKRTGRALDVSIEGPGYFRVRISDGEDKSHDAFTRRGNFIVGADGQLGIASNGGYPLYPPITVPFGATSIEIASDGRVCAIVSGGLQCFGHIQLARFDNEEGLKSIGDGLFVTTEASGEPTMLLPDIDGTGALKQGALEGSTSSSTVNSPVLLPSNMDRDYPARLASLFCDTSLIKSER